MIRIAQCFSIGLLVLLSSCQKDNSGPTLDPDQSTGSSELYFPPLDHSIWEQTDPADLEWNTDKLADLNSYLESKGTKGFIMVKDGRLAVEEYFDDHTINKNWEWYSAAKSLTSTLVGIAQMEGHLDVEDRTSDHLGLNWSIAPNDKEDLIKLRHHLSMTTGLENPINNLVAWTCTAPICMNYEVDAGSKWEYHQGAFTLNQDIITKSTGLDFKQFCKQRIQDKIGMNGTWNELLSLRIFSSTTRSMARFGLLALNKGNWDGTLIYPEEYYQEMVTPSQEHNKAYGYLWWLNGEDSFLVPGSQLELNGSLIPNAPADMFCALGAQDQKIYVVPSENLVVVRCGDSAGNTELANSSFDNELWGKINQVIQ